MQSNQAGRWRQLDLDLDDQLDVASRARASGVEVVVTLPDGRELGRWARDSAGRLDESSAKRYSEAAAGSELEPPK